jgi:hypothetical protein
MDSCIRKILPLFFLLCSVATSFAQEDYEADSVRYTALPKPTTSGKNKTELLPSSKKAQYFFTIQVGSLVGCNDCDRGKDFTFSAATVHGVSVGNKLRLGVGLGFDSYLNWQTLPLFGQASWDLFGSRDKNALFVQMAYGWAHPWFVRSGQYSYYTSDPFQHIEGGRMINPQIGYRIKYYDLRISFSLGYKHQNISYQVNNNIYCDPAACPPNLQWSDVSRETDRFQFNLILGLK